MDSFKTMQEANNTPQGEDLGADNARADLGDASFAGRSSENTQNTQNQPQAREETGKLYAQKLTKDGNESDTSDRSPFALTSGSGNSQNASPLSGFFKQLFNESRVNLNNVQLIDDNAAGVSREVLETATTGNTVDDPAPAGQDANRWQSDGQDVPPGPPRRQGSDISLGSEADESDSESTLEWDL